MALTSVGGHQCPDSLKKAGRGRIYSLSWASILCLLWNSLHCWATEAAAQGRGSGFGSYCYNAAHTLITVFLWSVRVRRPGLCKGKQETLFQGGGWDIKGPQVVWTSVYILWYMGTCTHNTHIQVGMHTHTHGNFFKGGNKKKTIAIGLRAFGSDQALLYPLLDLRPLDLGISESPAYKWQIIRLP